ncbi:MAG: zf-HC2 domain-containing protein [Alicyclobacillus sp.]|nr:zf-HC2 domain-containing protein [Alicyclobacillus sp.]
MSHLRVEDLWRYLDGELTVTEAAEVQTHTMRCPMCAERLEHTRQLAARLETALRAAVPAPRATFHDDVVGALHRGPREHAPERRWRWKATGAAAAAVVVAAGAGWTLAERGWVPGGGAGSRQGDQSVAVRNAPSADNLVEVGAGTGTSSGVTVQNLVNQPLSSRATQLPLLAKAASAVVAGSAEVTVDTASGAPLAGVHVVLIAGGRILHTLVTNAAGQTPRTNLQLAVDPALAPILSGAEASLSPQGDLVVVVWRTGYRPIVAYDVGVFGNGDGTFTQTFTMQVGAPGETPERVGYGFDTGPYSSYHVLAGQALAAWAASLAPGSGTSVQSRRPASDTQGGLSIHVQDPSGRPVSGASVRILAGVHVSQLQTTDANGNTATIQTPGIGDWRFSGPWNVAGPPEVATVIVWKDGYAPAVGYDEPVRAGGTRTLTVQLEPIRWRQSHGWDNNLGAASDIAGTRLPSPEDAARFVQWAQSQS